MDSEQWIIDNEGATEIDNMIIYTELVSDYQDDPIV